MNNKLLSALLIAGVTATWFAWISNADESNADTTTNTVKEFKKFNWDHGSRGWNHKWGNLTDDEKAAIDSMTDDEKREFFEAKRTEHKASRDAKETVIDTLLAWDALSTDQETLRAEIISERAERKIKQVERETQREEMKALFDKKKAWEDLTDWEIAQLEEFKSKHKGWKKWKWRHFDRK